MFQSQDDYVVKIPNSVINKALEVASSGNSPSYKHGAVIWRKNRIISAASNVYRKTHPLGSGIYCTLHAEVNAIIKALKFESDLSKHNLLVIRINNFCDLKPSKPCKDCMQFINKHRLNVFWS